MDLLLVVKLQVLHKVLDDSTSIQLNSFFFSSSTPAVLGWGLWCGQGLTVIVDNGAHQLVLLQHGEEFQGLGLAKHVAALQALDPSHKVIHLDARPVVG